MGICACHILHELNKCTRGGLVMHIVVCLKHVYNPEITPRYFEMDPETNRPVDERMIMVLSSFAEMPLELAIHLGNKTPGTTVLVVSWGFVSVEGVLHRSVPFPANTAVRV